MRFRFTAIAALLLMAGTAVPAVAQDNGAGVVSTTRKSMTYVPMRNTAGATRDVYAEVERVVRTQVEQVRFDINELPGSLREMSVAEIAQLTRDYIDQIKLERAGERAEYDVRFKDLNITAADLVRIANSAYLYAPNLRHWNVEHTVSIVTRKQVPVRIDNYEATVGVNITFYRVDFDTGAAVEEFVLSTRGRGFASSSPPFLTAAQARANAVAEALESLALDVRTKVRNLEPFKLQVNVERATGNGAYFPLTAKDGLVLDSLLKVEELTVDNKRLYAGYLIVREVGDGVTESQSYAQIISTKRGWTLSGGEMLAELAQKGYQFSVEGWAGSLDIQPDLQGRISAADTIGGLRLVATRLLAEELNFSGFRAGLNLGLGFAGDFIEGNAEIHLEKTWSFRRVFFGPALRVGALRAWTAVDINEFGSEAAAATSFGATAEGTANIFLTPNFYLRLRGGYRLYAPTTTLSFRDDTVVVSLDGFEYDPSGWQASGGLAWSF